MQMPCARLRFVWAALLLVLFAGCGGGDSSVTTCSGGALAAAVCSSGGVPTTVALTNPPTGPNTTEVIVDSGTAGGFSSTAANVPYVTVTICPPSPGAAITAGCVTIDHVFLDTGSYGLRLLKSSLVTPSGASLALPELTLPANVSFNSPAGTAKECYPFVLGGIWGPIAKADVHIGGEAAAAIPIQVIDDPSNATLGQQADCITAAGGQPTLDDCVAKGGTLAACTASAASKFLFSTSASLQANGILGVGMLPYDCGLTCTSPLNYAGFFVQYYVCPDSVAANCRPAAVDTAQQVQNPVVHFIANDSNPQHDDNGTIVSLPDLSPIGAGVAKGSLVFGIGTRNNNQIAATAKMIVADVNPYIETVTGGANSTPKAVATCTPSTTTTCASNPSYLYFATTVGSSSYPDSYIDSGSNAFFFTDPSISNGCASSTGSAATGGWYCPPGAAPVARSATLRDWLGNTASANFSIASADLLFSTSSTAFNNLGGSMGSSAPGASQTFVWGLPFFYGRSVYTSIWGQALSPNGPWNAF
jgi:hypothetical protein